jgi:hypothetical protein
MTGFHLRHGQLHHHDRIASLIVFHRAGDDTRFAVVRHVFDLPAGWPGDRRIGVSHARPSTATHQEEQRFTESDH